VDEETGEGIEDAVVVVKVAGVSRTVKTETKIIPGGYWGEWERLGYSARAVGEEEYSRWPMGWVQTSENSASDYGKCIVIDGGQKSYWVSEVRYGRRWVENFKREGGYFRTFVWRDYELEISAKGYEGKKLSGRVAGNLGKIPLRYYPFDVWLSENSTSLTRGWSSHDFFQGHERENTWKLESRIAASEALKYSNQDAWRLEPAEWSAKVEHWEKTGTKTETVYEWSDWNYSKTEYWNGSSYQSGIASVSKSTYDGFSTGWSSFTDKDDTKYYYGKSSAADVVKTKVKYKVYHWEVVDSGDWWNPFDDKRDWVYKETKTEWVDGHKKVGDSWRGGWFGDWYNEVIEVLDYEYGNYRYYCFRSVYTRSQVSKGTRTVDVYDWVSKGTQTLISQPRNTSEYRYSNVTVTKYDLYRKYEKTFAVYKRTYSPESWPSASFTIYAENRNGYDNAIVLVPVVRGVQASIEKLVLYPRSVVNTRATITPRSDAPIVEIWAADARGRVVQKLPFGLNMKTSPKPSDYTWRKLVEEVPLGPVRTSPEIDLRLKVDSPKLSLFATFYIAEGELAPHDVRYRPAKTSVRVLSLNYDKAVQLSCTSEQSELFLTSFNPESGDVPLVSTLQISLAPYTLVPEGKYYFDVWAWTPWKKAYSEITVNFARKISVGYSSSNPYEEFNTGNGWEGIQG
ncbi:MAG: hypothetical protein QXT22_05880, partial [Candidatus Hadarchaeales archaeon]